MTRPRKSGRGPLFVIRVLAGQLRVGKPREPFAEIELRQDAKAGDKLILTERDLSFINDSIMIDRAMGRVRSAAPPADEISRELSA